MCFDCFHCFGNECKRFTFVNTVNVFHSLLNESKGRVVIEVSSYVISIDGFGHLEQNEMNISISVTT